MEIARQTFCSATEVSLTETFPDAIVDRSESWSEGYQACQRRWDKGEFDLELEQGLSDLVIAYSFDPLSHLRVVQSNGSYEVRERPAHSFAIHEPGQSLKCQWSVSDSNRAFHLGISGSRWRELKEHSGISTNAEIPTRPFPQDSTITHWMQALQKEMTGHRVGVRLYVDTLLEALQFHLLSNYIAGIDRPLALSKGRLRTEALTAALELIHDNYRTSLGLDDLAQAAHLSPFHFARSFKVSTGRSPYQYLIAVRVERAAQLLRNPRAQRPALTNIASECGFSDQSHLTRHFKRVIGTTPGRYARDFD